MDHVGESPVFDAFLNGKPTVCELLKHVNINTKWYQFGVLLKLSTAKLDGIDKDFSTSDRKALKMFDLWLSSKPFGTRKQIIDTLKTEIISENTIAEKYQKTLAESKS